MLKAKKFNLEKFPVSGGYFIPSGWGVFNTKNKGWVAFNGNLFNPVGGKKAAEEVAKECTPANLEYVWSLEWKEPLNKFWKIVKGRWRFKSSANKNLNYGTQKKIVYLNRLVGIHRWGELPEKVKRGAYK